MDTTSMCFHPILATFLILMTFGYTCQAILVLCLKWYGYEIKLIKTIIKRDHA